MRKRFYSCLLAGAVILNSCFGLTGELSVYAEDVPLEGQVFEDIEDKANLAAPDDNPEEEEATFGSFESGATWSLDGTKDKLDLNIFGEGETDSYGADEEIPWNKQTENIKFATIGSDITNIGARVFERTKIGSVTIPKKVKKLGDWSFYDCTELESVSLTYASALTSIGDNVFYGDKKLKNIELPSRIKSMGSNVFEGCESLEEVTIRASITKINARTFYGCKSLESIVIPIKVTTIDNMAFYGCDNLKDIYYEGSYDDWNDMNIHTGNYPLEKAVVHFYSTGKERQTISESDLISDNNNNNSAASDNSASQNRNVVIISENVITYYIITATAGEGGSISPSGEVSVSKNSSRTFYMRPDSGYEVDKIRVDKQNKGSDTSYTFENITGQHNIVVTFKKIENNTNNDDNGNPVTSKVINSDGVSFSVTWTSEVSYNGRKHVQNTKKTTGKQSADIAIGVAINGQNYTDFRAKFKNNKNVADNSLDYPYFTIKLRHVDRSIRKALSSEEFRFDINPARLSEDNVSYKKAEYNNGNPKVKGLMYKGTEGVKIKLKELNNDLDGDYRPSLQSSGGLIITGFNNFAGECLLKYTD